MENIGDGATADVYRALRSSDGVAVAIKLLRKSDYASKVRFQRELWAYREFEGFPFVVDLLDSDLSAWRPYLVLEFCQHGSASHNLAYLNANPKVTLALLTHLATSLEEIQRRGCIYRDLKPDNLLLTRDSVGNMVMKLGDAGLICLPGEFGRFVATRTPAGTLPYMAPELFTNGAEYTKEAEVFALGVTAHELLTGARPIAGAAITSGPVEVRDLIGRMVASDPRARPEVSVVRAELLNAYQAVVSQEQKTLALLCGGILALIVAALLKGKR
jgi:serine/threonine protein kinase